MVDLRRFVASAMCAAVASSGAHAQVNTVQTAVPSDLADALNPSGLSIVSVQVRNGDPMQFGTFSGFSLLPVRIPNGIVMSSGSVARLGPTADTQAPDYDPASPPSYLCTDFGSGATSEFTAYGTDTGAITNFFSINDVASIEVIFDLPNESNVKFDYVFGSVEFPAWTDQFTDAFVAFVDSKASDAQACFDPNGMAIQVGQSFASLVTLNDSNTAFSSPHGLIRKLTTTTAVLSAGRHRIWFEVGDVNDGILDSAVFIANLRAEAGDEGTDQAGPDDCLADLDRDGRVDGSDLGLLLAAWGPGRSRDLDEDDQVSGSDLGILLSGWGSCPK